jgi:Ca2+-binding EF-hand superfamily protein
MVSAIQGNQSFSAETLAQMREKMFQRLDPDGDGQINLTELKTESAESSRAVDFYEHLAKADTDGDGNVSRKEFDAMQPPPPPMQPPSDEMMAEMRDKMFEELDPDGDGQIVLSELLASTDSSETASSGFSDLYELLSAADTDGDGIVSRDEFDAMKPPPRPDENSGSSPGAIYSQDPTSSSRVDLIGSFLDQLV